MSSQTRECFFVTILLCIVSSFAFIVISYLVPLSRISEYPQKSICGTERRKRKLEWRRRKWEERRDQAFCRTLVLKLEAVMCTVIV